MNAFVIKSWSANGHPDCGSRNAHVIWGVILGALAFFWFGIIGIAITILYYVLNKTLTIGFTDVGGRVSQIPCKRSVIEGKNLDEAEAARVCDIIQHLVDAQRGRALVAS